MRVIGLFPPNCKIRCYEVPFYVVSRSLIKTLSQLPSSCNSSCHGESDGVRVNAVVKWSWMNNLIKINSGADYQTQMGVKGRFRRSVNVPRMEATICLIKRGYGQIPRNKDCRRFYLWKRQNNPTGIDGRSE